MNWLQVKDSRTPAAGRMPLAAVSPIVNPCAECYDLYNAEKNAGFFQKIRVIA
jgi:hypothetical protein